MRLITTILLSLPAMVKTGRCCIMLFRKEMGWGTLTIWQIGWFSRSRFVV